MCAERIDATAPGYTSASCGGVIVDSCPQYDASCTGRTDEFGHRLMTYQLVVCDGIGADSTYSYALYCPGTYTGEDCDYL